MTVDKVQCHCQSTLPFDDCCGPILKGAAIAGTAEQLMRSRYSAFCIGDIDYLLASSSAASELDRNDLLETFAATHWLALKILRTEKGKMSDSVGTVEFVASFHRQGELDHLHEKSQFRKQNGKWIYVDGEMISSDTRAEFIPGRNSPCWCGSGKKYKKCHG